MNKSAVLRLSGPVGIGLIAYVATSAVVVLGVYLGQTLLKPGRFQHMARGHSGAMAFASWDGHSYARIAEEGYFYDPARQSAVAFFPLYPLGAATLHRLTGLDIWLSLLFVAHLCLAATFVLAGAYVRLRYPDAPPALADFVLLALGLFPPTLFFRMAYSESLFLLLILLALYGMERQWLTLELALLIGLASAARLTGLALVPPFLLYLWRRSPSLGSWVRTAAWAAPLACWGIVAYILFQWVSFGEPLAFAKTQEHWRRRPPVPLTEKVLDLVTLEPVISRFDRETVLYWKHIDRDVPIVFSHTAADPVLFLAAVGLLLTGWANRWLSESEWLLGAGLLLIAYVGTGYETGMSSAARYAAVVFPIYLVLGQLLIRLRLVLAVALLVLSGFWLASFSALFTAWHRVI